MKRLCNRFCNFMQLYATLLFLTAAAAAQEPPSPEMAQEESGAAATSVPPVLLRDVKLQTIGEERFLEELPPGLIFIDAATGKVMVADENDPHGRAVCTCRDIDCHSFTNTARFNGHRLEYNQYWSQVAEGWSLLYRFGTNSWLRLVGGTSGSLANLTVDSYDPTNGVMVVTADATEGAVLQVSTNLVEAEAWKTATNATVTAATDAATTWSIAMLGTDVEFYRVLAEVQREAGIHAEKTIHANAGIEMGGETWDEWPTNHATVEDLNAASNAISARVGALEERAGEHWCKWVTNTVAPPGINWIPAEWPARTVYCYAYMPDTGFNIALPDWTPEVDCTLHLRIYKVSSATGSVCSANGNVLIPLTGNSSTVREAEFAWRSGVGWLCTPVTLSVPYGIEGGARTTIPNFDGLPEDGRFAPSPTNPVTPSLSMSPALSPSLSPLLPEVLQPVEEMSVDGLGEEAVDERGFEEAGEEAEQER